MADGATATRGDPHTEAWQDKPWKHFQRVVFRLQKRIYQAQQRHDRPHVIGSKCIIRIRTAPIIGSPT